MALSVEDGTVVQDANSYVTLVEAAAYHVDRNNTAWAAGTPEQQTAALIYATMWIDNGPFRWRGEISSWAPNRLRWPRINAYGPESEHFTGIPTDLKNAVCELALAHLSKGLNEVLARGGEIGSVTIGPISVGYSSGASPARKFPMVERYLKRLHLGTGNTRRIARG